MGSSYPWGFILVTVALLLDQTSADVLVQPGYGQPGKSSKDSMVQSQSLTNQPTAKPQQNYSPQQDPSMHLLQQQHTLQQQYLQHQHQQERNQLLQLQHQELQNPGMYQYPNGGQEIVGLPWGMRPPIAYGPLGALGGTKLFHLGPLGLNSFRFGSGLGGMGFPLLLSPHQPGQMQGSSAQFEKSMDGPTQPRTKRDIRDSGDSSGRKYRQKNTRVQQDGVATNPSLMKSKPDSTPQNAQTGKTNDQIVGDASNNHNEESVGSSMLDPFGLVDKTEDLIDDLKSGHLPNPLHALSNGGLIPGLPNWLNKGNTQTPQFEEHVVGQSQQYPQDKYNMMNQQQRQSQQPTPIVGDVKRRPYPSYPYGPPPPSGHFGPPGGFGTPYPYSYRPSPSPYRPSPVWLQSTNEGSSAFGAKNPSSVQTNWGNPMTGSANPGAQNPTSNSNVYQKMTGAQNPAVGKPQMVTEKGNPGSGQSSSVKNSMGKDQIVGSSNPQVAWGHPTGGYEPIVGSSNPVQGFYQLARAVQPMMGTLLNPLTGNAGPGGSGGGAIPYNYQPGGRNMMVGSPPMNSFYDPGRQMNYYGQERHIPFDLDDMYDDRYNHHMHHGGYNRIYDSYMEEVPFGFGGGYPQYMHNHEGYIF